jgi:hypothetical protein
LSLIGHRCRRRFAAAATTRAYTGGCGHQFGSGLAAIFGFAPSRVRPRACRASPACVRDAPSNGRSAAAYGKDAGSSRSAHRRPAQWTFARWPPSRRVQLPLQPVEAITWWYSPVRLQGQLDRGVGKLKCWFVHGRCDRAWRGVLDRGVVSRNGSWLTVLFAKIDKRLLASLARQGIWPGHSIFRRRRRLPRRLGGIARKCHAFRYGRRLFVHRSRDSGRRDTVYRVGWSRIAVRDRGDMVHSPRS